MFCPPQGRADLMEANWAEASEFFDTELVSPRTASPTSSPVGMNRCSETYSTRINALPTILTPKWRIPIDAIVVGESEFREGRSSLSFVGAFLRSGGT